MLGAAGWSGSRADPERLSKEGGSERRALCCTLDWSVRWGWASREPGPNAVHDSQRGSGGTWQESVPRMTNAGAVQLFACLDGCVTDRRAGGGRARHVDEDGLDGRVAITRASVRSTSTRVQVFWGDPRGLGRCPAVCLSALGRDGKLRRPCPQPSEDCFAMGSQAWCTAACHCKRGDGKGRGAGRVAWPPQPRKPLASSPGHPSELLTEQNGSFDALAANTSAHHLCRRGGRTRGSRGGSVLGRLRRCHWDTTWALAALGASPFTGHPSGLQVTMMVG